MRTNAGSLAPPRKPEEPHSPLPSRDATISSALSWGFTWPCARLGERKACLLQVTAFGSACGPFTSIYGHLMLPVLWWLGLQVVGMGRTSWFSMAGLRFRLRYG